MSKRLTAADLHGIYPAIPTPTTAQDTVDEGAVRVLIDYLIKGGMDGIVPLGGTGEYCSLSHEQRVRMVAACVEAAGGRVPVIAGILHPGFQDSLAAGKACAGAGADALMVLTPYYSTPSQTGIRDYFLRFADASPVPIMLYEIPYRTRISIAPEVIHELSRHENIIGMKACNTDMYHFLKVVAGVSDNFRILSGEDTLFPLHMVSGAKGGIIVTASVLPKSWKAMYDASTAGDHAKATAMHRNLIKLMDMCFAEPNPGPLKSSWDLIGVDAPHILAPLVPANEDLRQRLRAELSARLKDEEALP
jgi:4-hydroxy-tetrahydrodipicolinate synthase